MTAYAKTIDFLLHFVMLTLYGYLSFTKDSEMGA